MLKSLALSILLIQDTNALLKSSSVGKHDFIKKMRSAQKANGISRRMNWNKLTGKSTHTPGLRSKRSPSKASKFTEQSTPKEMLSETRDDRSLGWWNFWSSNVTDEEIEDLQDQMNETEYPNNWYNWNWTWFDNSEDDMWETEGNQTFIMQSLNDFSIKYAGCSSLTSFYIPEDGNNDDGDGAAQNPFTANNYVSYRLCPSETCQDNSWSGCKSEYGEYMMDMSEFLATQQDYVDEEFEAYCTYCANCVYFDNWYSGWNYSQYDEEVHGCDLYDECEDYNDYCSDEAREEAEEELGYNYEDFLECTAVDVNLGYYGAGDDDRFSDMQANMSAAYGYDGDSDYSMTTGYIGPHCDNGIIGIGLFSDEYCTNYVGNKFDIFNVTEYEMEAATIDNIYVPDGCHTCAGENIMNSQWYIPENDRDAEDYQEYNQQMEEGYYENESSEVCYNMYTQSAKCHSHLTDEFPIELSDDELSGQEASCNFIEDVVKGHFDDEGFVWSHQERVNPVSQLFGIFNDDIETRITGAQVAALTLTSAACGSMGYIAYLMKLKVDAITDPLSTGLMA
uniref:Uncharacterized protein n=1 Tax=Chaetoceros debilis TaxID=122233 RepID=A0A7S3Q0N2_9STRA|mmetsp:Transcript_3092/g.4373  ORF Transcript_3092/g.4373 Transcript_3092/m.4373 type:complete len:563 (-) Transcript_3092:247-1935(-)|eukprot:CAMPEP_0194093936 /NCGR_PEP_ID=MMETSP0149-20130528/52172_1 /TAXON_ID=122233 /ORGANISM="Chaetoceros debilis, Strain MM31A-1" /LENGTH=562 /DNA_ID=CAMNT_0038779413 /DNA_START=12 /DNA_END=1700 /DNA_ORIENTATION=+